MRRRILGPAATALLVAFIATGCFNLHARTGRVPGARVREHVEESSKAVFLFWGLVRVSDPSATVWTKEPPPLESLHLHTYMSLTDALITTASFGVIVPWTIDTQAEVLE